MAQIEATNDNELMDAMMAASPGDTILLDGEFTNVIWNKDGGLGEMIVIKSKNPENPARIMSDSPEAAFEFSGAKREWIAIENVIFEGTPSSEVGVKLVGHPSERNNRHRNLQLRNCTIRGFRIGIQAMRFSNVMFLGCHVHDCTTRQKDKHAHGAFMADFDTCRIRHCVFERCGLDPHREDGRNIFSHGVYTKAGTPGERITNFNVSSNLFYDCGSWSLTCSTEDHDPGSIDGVTVYDNHFVGSANGFVSGGQPGSARKIRIHNNTFVNLGRQATGMWQAFGIEAGTTGSPAAMRVVNNKFLKINDMPEQATVEPFLGAGEFIGNVVDPSWHR